MAIPTIPHTLKKLTSNFTLRIGNLPPNHQLRTLTTFNPAADWHLSANPITALTRLLPTSLSPFTFPSHPSQSRWVHPHVRDNTVFPTNPETKEYTQSLIRTPPPDIYHLFIRILTVPSPPFAAGFLVFRGERLVHSGTTRDVSRPGALLQALFQGLTYASFSNCIRIFLPDGSISASIFCTSKHPLLSLSRSIIDQMITFLSSHALHRIDLFRYSIKWSGLPGKTVLDNFTDQEQRIVFPIPPTPLLKPKDRLLRDIQAEYLRTNWSSQVWQSIILPDGKPPPFIQGAISRRDRGTFSSAGQLATGHAFHKPYSIQFRREADDNNVCPCSAPTPPSPAHSTQSFDRLMAEFLSPRSHPRASLPRHQRHSPR